MARRSWLLVIACVGLLGGCTSAGSSPGDYGHQRARDELARYEKAVQDAGGQQRFVPVGDLTGQIGTWEFANGGNKQALYSGRVQADAPLPDAPQPTGTVRWDSGVTLDVPLISATEALHQLTAAGIGDCRELCTPLHITGARLSTVQIKTTHGPATVPGWEYTLQGTAVKVTRAAVAPSASVTVAPEPWDPDKPFLLPVESATTTVEGRQLTVFFTGAPDPASKPCGEDYSAEAVESDNAVVVLISWRAHGPGESCPGVGARRSAIADLARPLGERAVLEARQGTPVSVTLTE
jgi:hypothetical protein